MTYRTMLCAVVFGVSALCVVEAATNTDTSDEAKAAKKEKMLQATGGILDVAAKGKVVIINAQERIPTTVVADSVKSLAAELKMNVELAEGSSYEMYKCPDGSLGAIVIADRDDLPMSVVAAECTWGILNVAKLDAEGMKAIRRFKREFARVVCFTFGQSNSQFKGSPLATVKKASDLDTIVVDQMTFDAQMMVLKTLSNLGMTQYRKTSYKKAVQEGWAPAPTNEYQQVIWDSYHAKPTEPMKIKFDPAKGE